MEKIKILELIDGGFLGGGQTNILSIISNLDPDLFEFTVAAKGGGKFEAEVSNISVQFFPLEMPKMLRHKYFKKLQELYNRENFHIVHSHGGVGGFYGRLLKKHNPEIKSVHTIHGIHYINIDSFFVRNTSKSIEQYLVQFTDQTICETYNDLNTAIKNKIADINKIRVIPNGIDITQFGKKEKKIGLLMDLGFDENNFIVGNISRFDVQKNQKLIIQSAYYLVKKFPEMRFVLVGDGKYFKRMKQYARDANLDQFIAFTGEQQNISDYYSIFDIFVFPSLWEGMPYVLLQAMASKLPVVCSNIPNHLEVIKNNQSALTINPYEADDLFHKISVLYNNKELRQLLGENAYTDVQKFDEKHTNREIERLYKEVLIA
ncbi:MAG: glycosyltransferase [Ignavibacteria bacterium]|jgi:glycosyltransferase involved in cell wall biosynthesis